MYINRDVGAKRLKAKSEGSKSLGYAGLIRGWGDLRIGTRIRDERFESVRGECVSWILL